MFIILEPGQFYTRSQILDSPNTFYVFGDNDARSGFGGQAKHARGCKNSIGIRTKKMPNMNAGSFYSDSEYFENIAKIKEDLDLVREKLNSGFDVVCPGGIGKGRAELPFRAPKTYEYLISQLASLQQEFSDEELVDEFS